MSRFLVWAIAVISLVAFNSCQDKNRLFEENIVIEKNEWKRDNALTFDFEVEDTTQAYNLLANIRSTNTYPYYNLYLKMELVNPEGIIILNDIKEGYLFDPVSGRPFGQGESFLGISLGDLYDQKVMLQKGYKFLLPGKYKLRLSHYMRDIDPITEVMAVGVRVEKGF